MARDKELVPRMPQEAVPRQWFQAYIKANEQFALLPPAIDAIVGGEVIDRISRRKASWQQLARTGFTEAQLHEVERRMTKLHLAHGIPLVGASMTNHHHHGTDRAREILSRFLNHHGRPLRTADYHGDMHAGHAVVNQDTVRKTWIGIAGETARAAVYFVRAIGPGDTNGIRFDLHMRTRENFLRRPIVGALDRFFGDEASSDAVFGLKQLYNAAIEYIWSDPARDIAASHRLQFNLLHEKGTTPFRVTEELRKFAIGLADAVRIRAYDLKKQGVIGQHINLDPFIGELIKHDRLT